MSKDIDDREAFYKRYPMRALKGMMGLSHDEIAVYAVLLEVMYMTWNPLAFESEEDKLFVFGWLPKARQKNSPIIERLIEKGRIKLIQIDGKAHLSDDIFERVSAKYGAGSGGKVGKKSDRSQGKVSTKSERSTPLLDPQNEENQSLDDTEKNRIEENREGNTPIEGVLPSKEERPAPVRDALPHGGQASAPQAKPGKKPKPEPVPPPVWTGDPAIREAVVHDRRYGEDYARSWLDPARPGSDGSIITRTGEALRKLKGCEALIALKVRVVGPP